jgi:hypothetical protein
VQAEGDAELEVDADADDDDADVDFAAGVLLSPFDVDVDVDVDAVGCFDMVHVSKLPSARSNAVLKSGSCCLTRKLFMGGMLVD